MDLHASQIQGFFDVPVDKCVFLSLVTDVTEPYTILVCVIAWEEP